MNIRRIRNGMVFGIVIFIVTVVSSCSLLSFDKTFHPADVSIDLSDLEGSYYVIKNEAYVETGDYDIDLSKLVYSYTLKNTGNKSVEVELRLSLYGDAADNGRTTVWTDDNSDGYVDTCISFPGEDEKVWLTANYKDKDPISSDGYGWVSMIGEPGNPALAAAGDTVSGSVEFNGSAVINQILQQDGVWLVAYISPYGATLPSSGDTLELINQSIGITGSAALF